MERPYQIQRADRAEEMHSPQKVPPRENHCTPVATAMSVGDDERTRPEIPPTTTPESPARVPTRSAGHSTRSAEDRVGSARSTGSISSVTVVGSGLHRKGLSVVEIRSGQA